MAAATFTATLQQRRNRVHEQLSDTCRSERADAEQAAWVSARRDWPAIRAGAAPCRAVCRAKGS